MKVSNELIALKDIEEKLMLYIYKVGDRIILEKTQDGWEILEARVDRPDKEQE